MNQPSETIRYYNDHADEYVKDTVDLNMEALYLPFLQMVPAGGKVLDAGCGSGRDTKAFLERGYTVTAIDASEKMVEVTTQLTGRPAQQLRLQDIDYQDEFDGIWACASVLHISATEIEGVMKGLFRALRLSGVCYLSFKEGKGERFDRNRRFLDFTASCLEQCLSHHPNVEIIRIWTTDDVRPSQTNQWVNALVRK
jgi:SAM-dependent methyltransferase